MQQIQIGHYLMFFALLHSGHKLPILIKYYIDHLI